MFCRTRMPLFLTLALASIVLVSSARAAVVDLNTPIPNDTPLFTVDQVNTIVAQAVGYLQSVNLAGIICVTDREGHILAIFRMAQSTGTDQRINEQATVKARTASYFESNQNAFSTRTAQFIVQAHFPPGVRNVDAGPLFGVPLSNLPASDVQLQAPPGIVFINGVNAPGPLRLPSTSSDFRTPAQPLVITPLTDDPGGLPLYDPVSHKAMGGIGVEIDGFGVVANGIPDAGVLVNTPGNTMLSKATKQTFEEMAAMAGSKGFLPPAKILGSTILINGFRFKYAKVHMPKFTAASTLIGAGNFEPYYDTDGTERDASGSHPISANPYAAKYSVLPFAALTTNGTDAFGQFATKAVLFTTSRGAPAQEFPRQGWVPRFPPRDSPLGLITTADVLTLVQQAADEAHGTRAAIRQPAGVAEEVWISVVDTAGNICGSFRTNDATPFSFDVHVQKARTAAFFSNNEVGFSSRAIGFLAQTTFPPGIANNPAGPISGLMNDVAGVKASMLGDPPVMGAGPLTEIAQLLVDDNSAGVVANPQVSAAAGIALYPNAVAVTVQLLSRRLPHTRDGRLSPLQVGISVDLELGRAGEAGTTTIPNGITIFAGGVPIYKNGVLVGGLGISGGGIDQDDIIAFGGSVGYRPPDGVGCDSASADKIVNALNQAVAKLKVQFPNLTNGDSALLDVITKRLAQGPGVLQGLRLPYIKEPRSPSR